VPALAGTRGEGRRDDREYGQGAPDEAAQSIEHRALLPARSRRHRAANPDEECPVGPATAIFRSAA